MSTYQRILVALDGSECSNLGVDAAIAIAENSDNPLIIGCHAYAAKLHEVRFGQMEPGLPPSYQTEERLNFLRNAHDDIINAGMQQISDAYLAGLAAKSQEKGIQFAGATPEGHNYVQLLKAGQDYHANILVLGAWGHGRVPEGTLGSVAERILLYAKGFDVLILRRPWEIYKKTIVVGIDGSNASYSALARAVELAKKFNARVHAVAVYDPFFHRGVFTTITNALSEKTRARFNFSGEINNLHDEIIDAGLETLYQRQLDRGVALAKALGYEITTEVLAGKIYPQLHHYAALHDAGIVVLGRFGIHAESESLLGSNTLNLARVVTTNLLVVEESDADLVALPADVDTEEHLEWDADAEAILARVPPFALRIA
ncbi:MAG TPA: universal stress protein, partial [Candidatus Lokiarchaeia archaeon]|nr:universal stress protein [Candidatus Lokiarchaeia archaeon]